MDFDASALLAGIAVSAVGYVLFSYGKRMTRAPHMIVGIGMMAYPYFVPGALLMCAIAAGLLGLLWGVVKLGY